MTSQPMNFHQMKSCIGRNMMIGHPLNLGFGYAAGLRWQIKKVDHAS